MKTYRLMYASCDELINLRATHQSKAIEQGSKLQHIFGELINIEEEVTDAAGNKLFTTIWSKYNA